MTNEIIVRENEERLLPIVWTGAETEITYDISLEGRGAKITFLALLLGKENQLLNMRTNVYHRSPDTTSEVIIKSALMDTAAVNFDGLVKIEPGATKTNAWLAAHVLLLSQKAKGRTVPSLEILENDIKAGHATTVGRISEKEVFYLMSRGISEIQAKQLIMHGFLQSLIDKFPKEDHEKAQKELALFGNTAN